MSDNHESPGVISRCHFGATARLLQPCNCGPPGCLFAVPTSWCGSLTGEVLNVHAPMKKHAHASVINSHPFKRQLGILSRTLNNHFSKSLKNHLAHDGREVQQLLGGLGALCCISPIRIKLQGNKFKTGSNVVNCEVTKKSFSDSSNIFFSTKMFNVWWEHAVFSASRNWLE